MFRLLAATRPGRAVLAALAVLVLGVLVGVAVLWPAGDTRLGSAGSGVETERADVNGVRAVECDLSAGACQRITATLQTGPEVGRSTTLTLPGPRFAPQVEAGDTIRIVRNEVSDGTVAAERYAFSDFERRTPLLALALVFATLVIALARWKGVRALLGLAASLLIVTQFMVPAILDGAAPLAVALVGALAVMLVTVALAHGVGVTSVAAIAGSALSLLATALLAVLVVGLAHVTGFSSEEATLLQGSEQGGPGGLSLEGLVLAGIVVGALGVLDDVTVSQASTVLALRRADPTQPRGRLFAEALAVGRDHLSATVNTLVLAYVGAALPVLLIFETQGTSFGEAIGGETVAGEVVAMLVGSIGLVLAVPLTTAFATWLADRLPAAALEGAGHGHAH